MKLWKSQRALQNVEESMLDNLKYQIKNHLIVIIGERFRYIGRAGNLVWLGFGKDTAFKNYKGENEKRAQYSLHIQCPLRIIHNEIKQIGSGDIYEPCSTMKYAENFDWDIQGANLFDEKARIIAKELLLNEITVTDIKCSETGDVRIYLSNGYIVEMFTNTSGAVEEWRFFETGSDKEHFVVTGDGINNDEI